MSNPTLLSDYCGCTWSRFDELLGVAVGASSAITGNFCSVVTMIVLPASRESSKARSDIFLEFID